MMRLQILLIIFFISLLTILESRPSDSAINEKKSSSKKRKIILDDFVSEYAWNNKKYYQYKIHGWTVYFEEILVNKKRKLGKKTFRKLRRDLRYAHRKLPKTAIDCGGHSSWTWRTIQASPSNENTGALAVQMDRHY